MRSLAMMRSMPAVEGMLAELRGRGELWQSGPGLIGMRGDLFALFRGVERAIFDLAAAETHDEWLVPAGIALETLARGWAFTIREVVCLGAARDIDAFRRRVMGAADALARALGLERWVLAILAAHGPDRPNWPTSLERTATAVPR